MPSLQLISEHKIVWVHASFACSVLFYERPLAAGLGLFSWIPTLHTFCFSNFSTAVGPAFTFSDFDRVGSVGFAFDVFCVTLLFPASQSLLNC